MMHMRVIHAIFLLAATLLPVAGVQAQPTLPRVDDLQLQRVLKDESTLWYDSRTIPPAYQHDGGFHSPSYNISDGIDTRTGQKERLGNANREFPWLNTGGIDHAPNVEVIKFLWLPKRSNGRPWPVVTYRQGRRLEWMFPAGAIVGEVLSQRIDGEAYPFEIRIREREIDDWGVDILRPFPTAEQLEQRLSLYGVSLPSPPPPKTSTYRDTLHPVSAFAARTHVEKLPPLDKRLVKHLLRTTTFKSANSVQWRGAVVAPTTDAAVHIVPRRYAGAFLGNDRRSCTNCHKHVGRAARDFDASRDWYGDVRGSDEIFSFHPIDPSRISHNGYTLGYRLRRSFVRDGIVARLDRRRHPRSRYRPLPLLPIRGH